MSDTVFPMNRNPIAWLCFLLFAGSVCVQGQEEQPAATYLGVARAGWTEWLDRDGPGGTGDFEGLKGHLDQGNACPAPLDIECRSADGQDWGETGQVVTCQPFRGAVCRNGDQTDGRSCLNYIVRFLCAFEADSEDSARFEWIQRSRMGADGTTRRALQTDFEHAQKFIARPVAALAFDESSDAERRWYSVQRSFHPDFRFLDDRRARGVGRIESLLVDPNVPWRLFATSPVGGLWVGNVQRDLWSRTGTDHGLPRSGVSSVAIAIKTVGKKCNHDAWFVASGQGNVAKTERGASKVWQWSDGVFRSYDLGKTWQHIGLGRLHTYHRNTIKKILAGPEECELLFAATDDGLQRTLSALHTEPKWEKVLDGIVYDVELNPTDGEQTVLASGSIRLTKSFRPFIARSRDLGATWQYFALPAAVEIANNISVIELAFSKSRPSIVYALATTVSEQTSDYLLRIDLQEADIAKQVELVNERVFAHRLSTLAVSPANYKEIIIGNINPLKRSTDGGVAFAKIGNDDYHDDQQDVLYINEKELLVATDGGVYRSTDGGKSWKPKNRGLIVTTIDGLDVIGGGTPSLLYGAFDLGSYLQSGSEKGKHLMGGDGRHCEIAPTDPDVMYVSHQSSIRKTTDRWQTYKELPYLRDSRWRTHFAVDSGNADVIYGASPHGVYRYEANSWIQHSGPSVKDIWEVWTVDIDPNIIYASTTWLESVKGPKLYRSVTRGGDQSLDWSDLVLPTGRGWLSDIAIDEKDPMRRVWAAFGTSIFEFNGHVWDDITHNLPDGESVLTILKDRQHEDRLYAGTHLGRVYVLVDESWEDFSFNLPHVSIHRLAQNERFIYAGTFGRGIWAVLKYDAEPGDGFAPVHTSDPTQAPSDTTH